MSSIFQKFQEIFPHWWLVVELLIILICLLKITNTHEEDKE